MTHSSTGAEAPAASPMFGSRGFAVLLLSLLGLLHLQGYLGAATIEHFAGMTDQLSRFEEGLPWNPLVSPTGIGSAGPLYYRLHQVIRDAGLPYTALHGLLGLLDAAALCLWVLWARRRVSPAVLWTAALWLALYPIPKRYLFENATFAGIALVGAYAAVLRAASSKRLSAYAAHSLFLGLAVHFSISALFVIPATAFALRRAAPRQRVVGALLVTGAVVIALLPQLHAHLNAGISRASIGVSGFWSDHLVASPGETIGVAWSMLGNPVAALALLGTVFVVLRSRHDLIPGVAVVWWLCATVPIIVLNSNRDPYQHVAANPAGAHLAGIGLVWILGRIGRGLRWPRALDAGIWALLVFATTWSVVGLARVIEDRRDGRMDGPQSTEENVCLHWRTTSIEAALSAADLVPEDDHPTTFHGAYRDCLDASRFWRGGLVAEDDGPAGEEAWHTLLLPRGDSGALRDVVPGGTSVAELVVWAPIQALDGSSEVLPSRPNEPHEVNVTVPHAGNETLYIEIEQQNERVGALDMFATRDGRPARVLIDCADADSGAVIEGCLTDQAYVVLAGDSGAADDATLSIRILGGDAHVPLSWRAFRLTRAHEHDSRR